MSQKFTTISPNNIWTEMTYLLPSLDTDKSCAQF